MIIGKIVKSNSHVDYAGRIYDRLETPAPPKPADYCFGQFVKIKAYDQEVVGAIYNSQLINPEYGNFGPRLSTPPELNAVFSPDYMNEQGVLIGILLLGWKEGDQNIHRIPRYVLPVDAEIETMTDDEVLDFHTDSNGKLQLHYFSHVMTHAGQFATQLLLVIVEQLGRLTSPENRATLGVLQNALVWQNTMEQMR